MHRGEYPEIVLKAATEDRLQILKSFAEFWKIPYVLKASPSTRHVVISSGWVPETNLSRRQPLIVSPAGLEDARRISEQFNLLLSLRESLIALPYSRLVKTSIEAKSYEFKGSKLETVIESNGISVLSRIAGSEIYLLSTDLVGEHSLRIVRGLADPPSTRFRLATKLPMSYKMIPAFIRNRAFRSGNQTGLRQEKLGPVECLRTIFLASIVTVSDTPVPCIGFWRKGKKFAFAVTHDVETRKGLQNGSKQLIRIEEEHRIRSTWNIVTNRYQLTRENLQALAESGEIGGHDTDHDGKLIFLPLSAQITRLKNCKETLERLTHTQVSGFRAPLLQHDKRLLEAVGKAGYQFDSSVPSWELLSPTSLKPHGVGTVFPFEAEGVFEVPVSLPQDHQLLRLRNLTPTEATNMLIRTSKWVSAIGGLCTLLVHPDYDFAMENQEDKYSQILQSFQRNPHCDILSLSQAVAWCSFRRGAYWKESDGELEAICSEPEEQLRQLDLLKVTSYGSNGFDFEQLTLN